MVKMSEAAFTERENSENDREKRIAEINEELRLLKGTKPGEPVYLSADTERNIEKINRLEKELENLEK